MQCNAIHVYTLLLYSVTYILVVSATLYAVQYTTYIVRRTPHVHCKTCLLLILPTIKAILDRGCCNFKHVRRIIYMAINNARVNTRSACVVCVMHARVVTTSRTPVCNRIY